VGSVHTCGVENKKVRQPPCGAGGFAELPEDAIKTEAAPAIAVAALSPTRNPTE